MPAKQSSKKSGCEKYTSTGLHLPVQVQGPVPNPPVPKPTATPIIDDAQVIAKLRSLKEPARLFGEDERMRSVRLTRITKSRDAAAKAQAEAEREASVDYSAIKPNTDPALLALQLRAYFKHLLEVWRTTLDARPEAIRASVEGKRAHEAYLAAAQHLQPLFRQLTMAPTSIESDVMSSLTDIAISLQHRDYAGANDTYYKVSIGNAAWPIGVTAVGIHERSAADRLNKTTHQIAHVLNNETSRKWLQSLKRLITFTQTEYP